MIEMPPDTPGLRYYLVTVKTGLPTGPDIHGVTMGPDDRDDLGQETLDADAVDIIATPEMQTYPEGLEVSIQRVSREKFLEAGPLCEELQKVKARYWADLEEAVKAKEEEGFKLFVTDGEELIFLRDPRPRSQDKK